MRLTILNIKYIISSCYRPLNKLPKRLSKSWRWFLFFLFNQLINRLIVAALFRKGASLFRLPELQPEYCPGVHLIIGAQLWEAWYMIFMCMNQLSLNHTTFCWADPTQKLSQYIIEVWISAIVCQVSYQNMFFCFDVTLPQKLNIFLAGSSPSCPFIQCQEPQSVQLYITSSERFS